jgi:hypothetical protein
VIILNLVHFLLSSPVLANFPWYSALITLSDDLLKVAHPLNAFQVRRTCFQIHPSPSVLSSTLQHDPTSMKGYESMLFNCGNESTNESMTTVQNILGIRTSGQMVSWKPMSTLTSTDSCKVCSIISIYRLLDVLAMLNGAHLAHSVPRRYFETPNKSFCVSANYHSYEVILKH